MLFLCPGLCPPFPPFTTCFSHRKFLLVSGVCKDPLTPLGVLLLGALAFSACPLQLDFSFFLSNAGQVQGIELYLKYRK